MPKVIVIDYIDGAGGEYFANFLNSHRGFYSERPMQENMQGQPSLMKYLNSMSLVTPNWDKEFPKYFNLFLDQCRLLNIDNVAIPYHLYKYPQHIDIISSRLPNIRYVKIDTSKVRKQVALDFVRKVYFRQLDSKDMSEIKFTCNDPQKVIERLPLLYIDMVLLNNSIEPSIEQRQKLIDQEIHSNKTAPSNDIVINYTTWFDTFVSLEIEYKKLCDDLGIATQPNLLALLMKRNTENQIKLNSFIKEIECQQYTQK